MSEDLTRHTAPIFNSDPIKAAYVDQARRQYTRSTDDIEIDDKPDVGIAEGGAWVAAWVWVTQEEAGFGRDEDETRCCRS